MSLCTQQAHTQVEYLPGAGRGGYPGGPPGKPVPGGPTGGGGGAQRWQTMDSTPTATTEDAQGARHYNRSKEAAGKGARETPWAQTHEHTHPTHTLTNTHTVSRGHTHAGMQCTERRAHLAAVGRGVAAAAVAAVGTGEVALPRVAAPCQGAGASCRVGTCREGAYPVAYQEEVHLEGTLHQDIAGAWEGQGQGQGGGEGERK
jgi:hypothetical protein